MLLRDAYNELVKLINSEASEQAVHEHFERYPALMGQCPHANPPVLMSKLPLGRDFVVDFAYIWDESGGRYFQLVEIERPSLRIFTAEDEFTSDFNHAVQQVADWDDWAYRNRDHLLSLMEPLLEQGVIERVPKLVMVRTLLVAGRRADALANTRRRRRWEQKVNDVAGRFLRTWDGFFQHWISHPYLDGPVNLRSIKCVRYRAQGFDVINNGD